MSDNASTILDGETVPHQERVRDVDAEPTFGLDPWRPLHPKCDRIHLQKPKADQEMQLVGKLWNGRSDVELRLLGYSAQDFEFLRYFPGLQRLNVQAPTIKNIEGLRHVAGSLKEFTLASTTVRLSLRPVARCAQLSSFHLQRQTKDFTDLRSLTGLRYLGLSGVSLPDLSPLLAFQTLRSLFLGFASRSISTSSAIFLNWRHCSSLRSIICAIFRHSGSRGTWSGSRWSGSLMSRCCPTCQNLPGLKSSK